jgi:hypothetical protein
MMTSGWVAGLVLSLVVTTELHAQSFWREPTPGPSLSLEFSRPTYPGRWQDFHSPWPLTGAVLVGFRYPLADRLLLAVELPFAHVSGKANTCTATCLEFAHGTIVGNPYFGAEVRTLGGMAIFRMGVRVPLQQARQFDAKDDYDNSAARMGFASEQVDRYEAFLPKVTSGMADVVIGVDVTTGFRLRGLAGVSLLYHPEAEGYIHRLEHYQLHSRLGAEGLWRLGRAHLGAGLLTRDRMTGVDALLIPEERRTYEASAKAGYRFGDWNVGLSLRLWHAPFQESYHESYWDWRVLTLMLERAL